MTAGSQLGPYRILEPLGEGGMGVVYRASHTETGQIVALKTVQSAAHLKALRREIHALTTIRHPGVVRIVDHGSHRGIPWYAMDLLDGEDLRRFGQRIWRRFETHGSSLEGTQVSDVRALSHSESAETGREPQWEQKEATAEAAFSTTASWQSTAVPPPHREGGPEHRPPPSVDQERPPAAGGELDTVLSLIGEVCSTLAFLHGEGLVNCDLKPENILITNGRPVIVDFGLTAHHPGRTGREELQAQRGLEGTAHYMAPERIRGQFVDARCDIYSVGCILYELVVGRPVFSGNVSGLFARHLHGEVIPPSKLVSGVSQELEHVMLKLLESDPQSRFGYADEVAAVLAELKTNSQRFSDLPSARPYLYRPGLVGRTEILRQLVELRESAAAGSGGLVLVNGESGIGKTRVAMDLTRGLSRSRMRVVTSEVAPPVALRAGTHLTPLYALRPLLLAIADCCQEEGQEVSSRVLGDSHSVLATYEPSLLHVPTDERLSQTTRPPQVTRQQLLGHLRSTLKAFARELPLLLILDDLGWADELSLSFLASLTPEELAYTPLLIVATYRTDEPSSKISSLASLSHAVNIELPRLDAEGMRSMVSEMLSLSEIPSEFLELLSKQTEGNPFFITEYLRSAINERLLFRDGHTWQLPEPPSFRTGTSTRLQLPRVLRDLVERRLSHLSPETMYLAAALATLGRETDFQTAQEVSRLPEHELVGAVDELIRRHILDDHADPDSLRFVHDKLREVAYEQAPLERQLKLHSRAAESLEAKWKGDPNEHRIWPTLGYHFASARKPKQAAHYLRQAAHHARATHANTDAIALYRDALAHTQAVLACSSPSEEANWLDSSLEIHESLGDLLHLTAQRVHARSNYEDALNHSPSSDRARHARLLRKIGKTWEVEHRHDEALRYYDRAEAQVGCRGDGVLMDEWIQVHLDRLWVYYWLGRVEPMNDLIEMIAPLIEKNGSALQRARFFDTCTKRNLRKDRYVIREETLRFARLELSAAKESGDFSQILQAHFGLGFVLTFHNQPRKGAQELKQALKFAERAGDLAQKARCLTYLAVASRMRREVKETISFTEQSLEASEHAGMRDYVAAARANESWIALQHGNVRESLNRCEEALEIWKSELALVFSFQWLALLPGIASALALEKTERALHFASLLLDESQQPLPGAATDALARALNQRAAEEKEAAEASLRHAMQVLGETENCEIAGDPI